MKSVIAILAALLLASLARGDELRETVRLAQEWGAERAPAAWDGTQADLLYGEYIVEVEWAHNRKWFEAIGQALHYAIVYDRRPAIILLRHPSKFVPAEAYRCQSVCAKHGIRLWVVPSKVTDTDDPEQRQ